MNSWLIDYYMLFTNGNNTFHSKLSIDAIRFGILVKIPELLIPFSYSEEIDGVASVKILYYLNIMYILPQLYKISIFFSLQILTHILFTLRCHMIN